MNTSQYESYIRKQAENIPGEMKTYPAWVVWPYEQRDSKTTKVLYDPLTGRRASVTDSRTWRSFEEAEAALESGRYDGLGFVFSSGDPYTGIDLDGCRDPKTGELTEWAQRVIATFDAYAEVSPSGEGVHIYVKGRTTKARKNSLIEVYSTARFFTVTGVLP